MRSYFPHSHAHSPDAGIWYRCAQQLRGGELWLRRSPSSLTTTPRHPSSTGSATADTGRQATSCARAFGLLEERTMKIAALRGDHGRQAERALQAVQCGGARQPQAIEATAI